MKIQNVNLIGGALLELSLPKAPLESTRVGQLAVGSNFNLNVALEKGGWREVTGLMNTLFSFDMHVFTNAGAVGYMGPTLAQCRTAYRGVSWAQSLDFFDCVSGIQKFVVPADAIYEIEARGGHGGNQSRGAVVKADVILVKGDTLSLLVGQRGTSQTAGCGGSFVVSQTRGPLLIAGGGAGFRNSGTGHARLQLDAGFAGGSSHKEPDQQGYSIGGGGAGFDGDGMTGATAARSFRNGGEGGAGLGVMGTSYPITTYGSYGGFGGGGGSASNSSSYNYNYTVGGGGGASGGNAAGAGNYSTSVAGTGGSCFIVDSAENPLVTHNTSAEQQHGQITIRLKQYLLPNE